SQSDSIRERLRAGELHLQARIAAAASRPGLVPIVRIVDGEGGDIASFAQRRADLLFRVRLRAARIWLQTPSVRVAKVFADSLSGGGGGPAELALSGELDGHELRASVSPLNVATATVPLSPQLVWTFFLPWDFPLSDGAPLLTALWVFALLIPSGYWL